MSSDSADKVLMLAKVIELSVLKVRTTAPSMIWPNRVIACVKSLLPPVREVSSDLSPKFPPALCGVLGVESLALGRHLVHGLSLQEFHRRQVSQC